jgi:hypothetical protein
VRDPHRHISGDIPELNVTTVYTTLEYESALTSEQHTLAKASASDRRPAKFFGRKLPQPRRVPPQAALAPGRYGYRALQAGTRTTNGNFAPGFLRRRKGAAAVGQLEVSAQIDQGPGEQS